MTGLIVIAAVVFLALILLASAIRIVQEYERGVIFRLGRVLPGARGPGLFFIIPVIDRMVKVNLQTVTMNVPPQDVITRDNVTVRVDAVIYFHVVEPIKAIVEIQNYLLGTSQIAQTTLRSILGRAELDELLAKREDLNETLQAVIDELTEPWGVKVTLVEIKDVDLPESMQRAMARQAEAERVRRAKVINAEGEFQASAKLSDAAAVIARHPIAYQLRLLQTMSEVAAEKNSTLVFPFPVELLRYFDRTGGVSVPATPGGPGGTEPAGAAASSPATRRSRASSSGAGATTPARKITAAARRVAGAARKKAATTRKRQGPRGTG
jgi:regulator of protease activity HflC (stomatin/prohibitin superfamily)